MFNYCLLLPVGHPKNRHVVRISEYQKWARRSHNTPPFPNQTATQPPFLNCQVFRGIRKGHVHEAPIKMPSWATRTRKVNSAVLLVPPLPTRSTWKLPPDIHHLPMSARIRHRVPRTFSPLHRWPPERSHRTRENAWRSLSDGAGFGRCWWSHCIRVWPWQSHFIHVGG